MRIKIIRIGKNKDKYIIDAENEFLKRLKPFFQIEIFNLKEISASKAFTKEHAKESEAEEILKMLEKNDFVISLDEKGKEFTSIDFSKVIQKYKDIGQNLTFIIGGPYGLTQKIREKSQLILAFSKMTFTHQMIRILLLEQLYRAICIITGKEYHY